MLPHLGIPELLVIAFIVPPLILMFLVCRWLFRVLRGSGSKSRAHGPQQ